MRRARKRDAAMAVSAAVILAATLVPVDQHVVADSTLCILCGERGGADFLVNIGLYLPFGVALAARGIRFRWILLLGGFLSATIETAQFTLIPGRDASLGDLLSNVLGATMGGSILPWWRRWRVAGSRTAALLPVTAAAAAGAMLLVALALLTPEFPSGAYDQRWTPRFPHSAAYGGTVMSTAVGPLSLPRSPGLIGPTDSLRRLLEAGAPVSATLRAGPSPPTLAPILGVYARKGLEVIMIGADGHDLVYRYRPLGARLRLDRGEIRFAGALASVAPGDTAVISVREGDGEFCGVVNGQTRCVPALGTGDTWALLAHGPASVPGFRPVAAGIWLAVLFLPAGLLSSRWRDHAATTLVVVVGLTLAPVVAGFPATRLPGIGAAVAGFALGVISRALCDPGLRQESRRRSRC